MWLQSINRAAGCDISKNAGTRMTSCDHDRRHSKVTWRPLCCLPPLTYVILCFGVIASGHKAGVNSVVALGANVLCSKMPGLAPRQRTICQSRPDAMVAVGEGIKMALAECRYQFKDMRWNCSSIGAPGALISSFRTRGGTREAAFLHAIKSAAVAYSVTQACSRGNLTSCGCDENKSEGSEASGGWRWGGCSADYTYGISFARLFLDAQEYEDDASSLMNKHNNRAGRKVFSERIGTDCKCHGVSGSCTLKTCWTTLPRFRELGAIFMRKYEMAREVVTLGKSVQRSAHRKTAFMKLKVLPSPSQSHTKPRRGELVYVDKSPSYCDYDPQGGSLGTRGRLCQKGGRGMGGCDSLCCGRGYNTHQYTRQWQCRCRFRWCCEVTCEQCSERTEAHTCK